MLLKRRRSALGFRGGLDAALGGVYGALASFLGGLSSLLRFFLGACVLGEGDAAGGAERRDRECRDESTHDGVLHQASYQTRCLVRSRRTLPIRCWADTLGTDEHARL